MANKIGFIGAGNMAGAIIGGILKNGIALPGDIAVCDLSKEKCAVFAQKGIQVCSGIKETAKFADILFMAVKPQNYEDVLQELKTSLLPEKILVSIAAGISTSFIKHRLGFDAKVVRVMPNTPLLLGEGATAICHCAPVTDSEFEAVKAVFESGGIVEVLPENQMNAIISVNSSSPAYVYLFAKAIIEGAVRQGIDPESAKALIAKTLSGSAEMLMRSGNTPDELIKMVSSPGGTTLKALEALNRHGFEDALIDAMECCTKRAEELGR